jgi:ABC-type lipoprotein export system ATPase subunit
MLKLRNITKYYSTGFVKTFVLRDIDLEVKEGDFVTIMGPSGAGKSTLLHILESYHLIDDLTVYENLETPLLYKKVKGSERKSRVCDMLDKFNIVGKQKLFPNQLSGGQQQRVAVARALIIEPKLILADEPTGNLNSKEGETIMEMFKELNQSGTTIIQVTHSEKNAAYGQKIINLLDGWIQE